MKHLANFAIALAATLCVATAAQAQVVSVAPTTSTINVGETVTLDFKATGFANPTFGGGFNLSFDKNVVELVSMAIPARWEFFQSTGSLDAASGTVSDVSFNTFNPIGGDFLTASATFKALAPGVSPITLTASDVFPFAKAGGEPIAVAFQSGSIHVSAVPEPGSLSLVLAGLGVLAGVSRRRRAASNR